MRINYILIDYENVQPEVFSCLDVEHVKIVVFIGAGQTKISFETAAALQRMGNKAEYIKVSGNGTNALDFHIAFYIGQLSNQDSTAYFHIISKDTGFDPLIKHLRGRKVLASRYCDISEIPLAKMLGTMQSVPKSTDNHANTLLPAKEHVAKPLPVSAPVTKTVAKPVNAPPPAKKPVVKQVNTPTTAKKLAVKLANATSPAEKVAVIISNLKGRGTSKPQTIKTLSSTIRSLFPKGLHEEELTALLQELQAKGLVSVDGTKVLYAL